MNDSNSMAPDGLEKKRILVIDDQSSIRAVVKSYLKELGFHQVADVTNGLKGLEYLSVHAVDLVICDWEMPKVSGLECLQKVRALDAGKTLPFLMMTSVSDTDSVRNAIAEGVSDYLTKPFQPAQLGMKAVKLITRSKHRACRLPDLMQSRKSPSDHLAEENSPQEDSTPDEEQP
ncbi:MAG: response regulator [Oleiphilaceae bacterium]|nr:response regulator [Oleiphilaceae bacterium]